MHGEAEKGLIEIAIFDDFAKALSLKLVDGSVEKIDPGVHPKTRVPDIYCEQQEGPVYYELTEACEPELVKAIKAGEDENSTSAQADISEDTLRRKLNKRYDVSPVELIVYTNGRTLLSDDELILRIHEILESCGPGQFRKVWFFGRKMLVQLPEGITVRHNTER